MLKDSSAQASLTPHIFKCLVSMREFWRVPTVQHVLLQSCHATGDEHSCCHLVFDIFHYCHRLALALAQARTLTQSRQRLVIFLVQSLFHC